jgi:aldehyde dehydrogenase (NAD+)
VFRKLDAIAMGRPVGQQWMDMVISAGMLRFEANLAQSLVGESSLLSPGQLSLVFRQPYGVTAGILPFNVPTVM